MEKKAYRLILITTAIALTMLAAACSLTEVCPTASCPTVEPYPTATSAPSIVGTWEGVISEATLTFTFEASGGFIEYIQGSEIARGQYALLETIVPTGITLIYDDGNIIYSIFEFLSADAMRLENVMPGEPRPSLFNEAYTFRRKNP